MPSLQYIRTSYEEIQVRISDQIPNPVSFIGIIQLQKPIAGQLTITIIDQLRGKPWHKKPKYNYTAAPLISNFQKCIRRQAVIPAVATAHQLLGQDAPTFLRRLAVILLEDALLQPHMYAQICWLMAAAGKRYTLTVEDIQVIMDSIVTALEAEERYDLLEEAAGPALNERLWLNEADPTAAAAYVGIRLRALAGGMKFDAAFLERLAKRLMMGCLDFQPEISQVDISDIPEFSVADHMQPAAIDFHCCPQLLEIVRAESGLKAAAVQDAIWWHRSSLNERKAPDSTEVHERAERFRCSQTWALIARTVSGYAEGQIRLLEQRKERVGPVQTLDTWFKTDKV
jgi:hypothetical protein